MLKVKCAVCSTTDRKGGEKMKNILSDNSGSVLTEYGLLVVIVAIGLIAVLGAFRTTLTAKFNSIISSIGGAK